MIKKRAIALPLFMAQVLLAAAWAAEPTPFEPRAATAETIAQLREGGLVLYLRHGPTDTSRPDRVPQIDLDDCATQRPLTRAGRELATRVGEAIRRAAIPLGEVLVSPMCRTRETAEAAFGSDYRINRFLMYTAHLTSEEKAPRIATTRQLLSAPVEAGSNRVIIAHAPNLMDVMGYFPAPEGVVVVFRPRGDGRFDYLATIAPADWRGLVP